MTLGLDSSISSSAFTFKLDHKSEVEIYLASPQCPQKMKELQNIEFINFIDCTKPDTIEDLLALNNYAKEIVAGLPHYEITHLNVEGPSFNSKSSKKLQLNYFKQYLLTQVIEKYRLNWSNVTIVQPTTLKLEACKISYNSCKTPRNISGGRQDKTELMRTYLDFIYDSDFREEVANFFLERELDTQKSLPKPSDDLVDSFFLALL